MLRFAPAWRLGAGLGEADELGDGVAEREAGRLEGAGLALFLRTMLACGLSRAGLGFRHLGVEAHASRGSEESE